MVGLEVWVWLVGKGVHEMTGSPDPKSMTCWANPELLELSSDNLG